MNSDIRIATGLPESKKLRALEVTVGDAAITYLVRLWCWAGLHRIDGDLSGLRDCEIENSMRWTRKRGVLVAALVGGGWIDGESLSRRVHDWGQHQAYVVHASARSAKSKAAADARWRRSRGYIDDTGSIAPGNAPSNAPSMMPRACIKHDAPVPVPVPSDSESPPKPPPQEPGGARLRRGRRRNGAGAGAGPDLPSRDPTPADLALEECRQRFDAVEQPATRETWNQACTAALTLARAAGFSGAGAHAEARRLTESRLGPCPETVWHA